MKTSPRRNYKSGDEAWEINSIFSVSFLPSYSSSTLDINQILSDVDQVLRVLIEDEGNYKGVEEFKIKHDED
jgi:hypothetical protein